MHSTEIKVPGYPSVVAIHHGDYSGMIRIVYSNDEETRSVEVPGDVLIAVSRQVALNQVRDAVIELLEQMEPKAVQLPELFSKAKCK
jgi:hypothetical protein